MVVSGDEPPDQGRAATRAIDPWRIAPKRELVGDVVRLRRHRLILIGVLTGVVFVLGLQQGQVQTIRQTPVASVTETTLSAQCMVAHQSLMDAVDRAIMTKGESQPPAEDLIRSAISWKHLCG